MHLVASICPSIRLCVCVCLSVKFGVKGGHYWSEGFVCLSVISWACADNLADAVDRLLFYEELIVYPVIHFYLPRSETSNQPVEFHLGVFWTPKSDFGAESWLCDL